MKRIEKGTGELVVTRCDGSIDLKMADHAFDHIAFLIDALVPANSGLPVRAWRDDGRDLVLSQEVSDGVAVVALVGEKMSGPRVGQGHHVFERRAVGCFATREVEDERDTFGITETMNFTGEPAPRAA